MGCDLTQAMIEHARGHYPQVYFWLGDVMEFSFASLPYDFPAHIRCFDRIFFNACFANMHDRFAVLEHSAKLLADRGKIVISHPLPKFVASLHKTDPVIVPHLLPSKSEADDWAEKTGLKLAHYESTEMLYLAIFVR